MTRNQWIVVVALGVVLCVCVCGIGGVASLLLLSPSSDRVTVESSESEPTVPRPTIPRVPTKAVVTAIPKAEVKLELGATGNYVNSIGSLQVFGQISNNSEVPVSQVQVAVSLMDASGNVVGAGSTTGTILQVIPAQSKSPFAILVSKPPTWKEIRFQIQGQAYAGATLFPPYLDLKTQGVTGRMAQFNFYTLSGTALNTGSKPAELVHVIAICWDATNKPVGVEDGYAKLDQVPAGGSAPFEVQFSNFKTAPARCDTYVQGREKR